MKQFNIIYAFEPSCVLIKLPFNNNLLAFNNNLLAFNNNLRISQFIMSAKRPAQHQIDQKTLQDRDPISKPSESQTANKVQIQRKIVEIKKIDQSKDHSKVQNKQQPIDKQDVVTQQKKQSKASSNLFSNLFKPSQSNGTGLFASTSTGLFSNNTTSLFSTTNSLFSNNGLNSATNSTLSTGLFSSNLKGDQKKKNSQGKDSIFSFQANGVPPVKSGSSLFGQDNENDQSGDSAQLQQAQKLQSDPSKSTSTYKYQQECELIKKLKVHKFKKNGGDLIQWVDLYVQKDIKSKLVYIIAKLPATQKTIFSGLLLENKSQIRHLNNKDENLEISCFSINKTDKKTLERNILKIQLQKPEFGKQLFQCVQTIVSPKAQQE